MSGKGKGREGKEKGRNRRCSKIKGKSKDMIRGDRKWVRREKGNEREKKDKKIEKKEELKEDCMKIRRYK